MRLRMNTVKAPVFGWVWRCGTPTLAAFCTTCTTATLTLQPYKKLSQPKGQGRCAALLTPHGLSFLGRN